MLIYLLNLIKIYQIQNINYLPTLVNFESKTVDFLYSKISTFITFSLQLAWISLASCLNLCVVVYNVFDQTPASIDFSIFLLSIILITAIILAYRFADVIYSFVIIWGLIGIYVNINDTTRTLHSSEKLSNWIIAAIIIVSVNIILSWVYNFYIRNKTNIKMKSINQQISITSYIGCIK